MKSKVVTYFEMHMSGNNHIDTIEYIESSDRQFLKYLWHKNNCSQMNNLTLHIQKREGKVI